MIGLFTKKEARRRRCERFIIASTVLQALTRDSDPDIVNWMWYTPHGPEDRIGGPGRGGRADSLFQVDAIRRAVWVGYAMHFRCAMHTC